MKRFIIILFLMMLVGTASAGQLGSYFSNKTISVTGSASTVGRYQFIINAHNTSGTDSATDIYLGTIRTDWADVQITDVSNNNLSFVIFNNSATAATIGWNDLNVGTGTTNYNIWYNASAQATSNADGYSTFPLFDDFPGTTLNATQWQGSGSLYAVSNNQFNIVGNNTFSKNGIGSILTFNRNTLPISITAYWKLVCNSTSIFQTMIGSGVFPLDISQNTVHYMGQADFNSVVYTGSSSTQFVTNWTNNTWYTTNILLSPSGVYNITFLGSWKNGTNIKNNQSIIIDKYGRRSIAYIDFIFVRNYTGFNVVEPAISTISVMTNWTGGSAPVSSFTLQKPLLRIPMTLQVNDTSTNTPTGWNWSWGDGTWTNGTTQNATHKYTTRGKFSVNLLSSNAGGSNTTPTSSTVRIVGYENYW